MRLGDLEQWDKPRVFLMSTTHGGETHGLAAMMATMDVYRNEPVIEHMIRVGKRLMTGIEQAARGRGVHEQPSIVVSYSHKDADIDQTIDAFDGAMEVYASALSDGADKFLIGPPSEMVYRTYNKRPEGVAAKAV
jgi:glutamate-1-semialdehyde 2,1-aminomutase